jgi:hypothetical protein
VLWGYFVYHPIKAKYKDEFADPQFIWKVKEDWYSFDFEFLDENRHWTTWKAFTNSIYADDILDFYPRADINEKLEYIKAYYSARNGYLKERTYLARADMEKFIDLASSILIFVDKNMVDLYESSKYTIFEALEKEYEELRCAHKWIGDL